MFESILAVLFLVFLFVGVPTALCLLCWGLVDLVHIQSQLHTLTADTVVDPWADTAVGRRDHAVGPYPELHAVMPYPELSVLDQYTAQFEALQEEFRTLTMQFVNNQHGMHPAQYEAMDKRIRDLRYEISLVQSKVGS